MGKSDRALRSSLSEAEKKSQLVYQQTSLQGIDNAPEPSLRSSRNRHAVSAADLLSQSMNAMTNDSSSKAENKGASRSQSFTLHGSSHTLLSKGSGAPLVRRNTTTSAVANSPVSPRDGAFKRSIYAPKDIEELHKSLEGLKLEDSDDGMGEMEIRVNRASSESSDSYDADVLGAGIESEAAQRLNKQGSSVSAGKAGAYMGSIAGFSADSDEYDDEDDFAASLSSFDDDDGPVTCCGFHAPQCRLPVNRIASAIVRYAPCFWCFPIPISATDRTVLTRLNIISAFFTIGQICATSWLIIVMLIPPPEPHEEEEDVTLTHGMTPNLWSLTGSMYSIGFLGAVIFVSNLVTLKVIQVVNLVGAIRYLWVLLWLLPFQIFFVLSIFDYYDVTEVWIKHWWRVPSMAWFRENYCAPGTAGTLCMVPVFGDGAAVNETVWCEEKYQATNCTEIRDTAQAEVADLLAWFYNANFAWGVVLIAVLYLIVNTLERIVSRPMVQKSREQNVPAWLSLPFLGCTVVGAVFRYSPSSVLSVENESSYSWMGTAFMASGILFMLAAALGWFISSFSILSSRDKRYKHLSVMIFIFIMAVTSFILTVIFVASISYSVALVEIPIGPDQKHEIACGVDTADSCSNCELEDPTRPKCPEWSLDDVQRVLQTQTKGSATLSVIFFIYSFSALRFGFVLRKHITMYQIDYI